MLITIAQMVLAELAGGVAHRLQQHGNGGVFRAHAFRRTGQAHLGKARTQGALAGDEGGTAGGAGIFTIGIGEDRAFFGDTVNIGRAIAHHAHVVGRDIGPADIIAENHQNIRPALRGGRARGGGWLLRLRHLHATHDASGKPCGPAQQHIAA